MAVGFIEGLLRMDRTCRIGYHLPQLYFSYFHVFRFLVLSVILTSLIYPLVAVVFGHSKLYAAVLRSFSLV